MDIGDPVESGYGLRIPGCVCSLESALQLDGAGRQTLSCCAVIPAVLMITAYGCNALFKFAPGFCGVLVLDRSGLVSSHFPTSGACGAVTILPCRRSSTSLGSPAGLRRTAGRAMVAVAASLAWITAVAGGMEAAAKPLSADAQLERAIADVRRGALTSAIGEIDRLIERFPNFRLAHFVRGDLLLARGHPIVGLGNAADGEGAHRIADLGNPAYAARERLEELRAEARARTRAGRDAPPADRVPRYLL